MGALVALLGSLFGSAITGIGKLISVETIKFIAWRALIMFIVFVALPLVLYNVLASLIFDFMDYAMTYISSSGLSSFTFQLTGMGAYIANHIRLVEAFALFMSFVTIRFFMRFIPFLK